MSDRPAGSPTEHESPVLRLLDDIAAQFRHLPVDQAAPQIVNHLRKFWPPSMRAELVHLSTTSTGDALADAVVAQLRPSADTRRGDEP